MINSLGLKSKSSPHKYKNSRYAIGNVSKKDLSKIFREFENFPYENYESKMPKYEPTGSYFYLAIQIEKCMMKADDLKSNGYPVRTEITAKKQIPISHVCSMDESELKEFLVNENLPQICST